MFNLPYFHDALSKEKANALRDIISQFSKIITFFSA